jgi:steroid delta-isomerase-like uncharacterized protein
MASKYETLAHHWFDEVWNQGLVGTVDQLMASDAIIHGLVDDKGNEIRGTAAFKEFHRTFRESFPDIQVTVEEVLVCGDKFTARCVASGTHQGGSLGLAPTGKKVSFAGICIARIKDGKIVEAWNTWDFLTMFQQLGTAKIV